MSSSADHPIAEPTLLQAVTDSVRDYAIILLDPAGAILGWSRGAQAIKGYSAGEIIGESFTRFYTSEDLTAGTPARMLETAAREGHVEDEGWRVRKDGTRFWADVTISAVRDGSDELRGFVKVTRDFTERRAALERIRQSEERLRLLVESVQDHAIFMLDPAGRISTWNRAAQRIKGYRAEEVIGRDISLFYTPEDVQLGRPAKLLRAAARDGRVEDEGFRVRKDGSRFWADVVISRVDDGNGNLIGFAKVTRDLTERKRAEEEVAERVRQQAAVSELGVAALQTPSLDAVMARAMETARDTLGVEVVNVLEVTGDPPVLRLHAGIGVDPGLIGHATVAPGARTQAGFTLDAGRAVVDRESNGAERFDASGLFQSMPTASAMSVVIHAPDQAWSPYGILAVQSVARRTFTPNDANFLQAVANVIAAALARGRMEEQLRVAEREAVEERGRAQQAQQALRERDDFITVAAHELRTPLTALQLKLQGLERGLRAAIETRGDAKGVGGRVEGAVRQTERLARLVERLLDVSRIASGRLEMNREEFDLADLVGQVAEDFRDPASQAGSELRLDLATQAGGAWDRLRIEQVLVNLLSNAVKYGAGKPIGVRLEVDDGHVRLTISDQGIGIAPDDLTRIFSRFERAAPIRQYGGLGLGLYVTKHIVEAHGGRIAVSSKAGEGSTFVVELPRYLAPGGAAHAAYPWAHA